MSSLLIYVLNAVPFSNKPPVQDIIAKLHSYLTCNLLIGLSIILSYRQFGGRPIECTAPPGFSSAWTEYVEQYCFSSNTYFVPPYVPVENYSDLSKQEKHINYYKWIPFFLLFQAACFKVPAIIWKYFHGQSGMRVGEIQRMTTNQSNTDPKIRSSNIIALCHHLEKVLKFHRRLKLKKITPHKFFRILNIKYSTYHVTTVYLIGKAFFLANVVCQFYLLNRFFLPTSNISNQSIEDFLSFDAWRNIYTGNSTWKESGIFPRITLCDFEVKGVQQSINYTVQCVLVINLFTEKAFAVLYAWYFLLSTLTFVNIINWIFSMFNMISAEQFIFNHLEMSGQPLFDSKTHKDMKEVQQQVRKFIIKYLKTDGLFILWLIAQHSDVVFTTDLIYEMWNTHFKIELQRQALKSANLKWVAIKNKRAINNSPSVFSVTVLNRNEQKLPRGSLVRTASAETLPTDSKLGSSDSDDYYDTFTIRH